MVYWNLPTEALYEEIALPPRGAARRGRPLRRPHRQAHRPRRERQVRREGAVHRRATSGGASTTAPSAPRSSTTSSTACRATSRGATSSSRTCYAGADPAYRLPSGSSPSRPGTACSRATCSSLPAIARGVPPPRAGVHRHLRLPASRRFPRSTGRARDLHHRSTSTRSSCLIGGTGYAGEIKKSIFTVLNYLLPLDGVLLDALLGQRRHGGRRRRSSSASPAPARPRSRPTRSAASSATTSTAGATTASSTSRAAATPRSSASRPRPSRRSTRPPAASARSSRTSSSTRSPGSIDLDDERHHREHARLLPARVHRQRRPREAAPATRRTSSS